MREAVIAATVLLLAAGCSGDKTAYEEAVEDMEPVYCYKSLAGVECFNKPFQRDSERLVNYFGPSPKRYDAPPKPEVPPLKAPVRVSYWVKDDEPVPTQKVYLAPAGSAQVAAPDTSGEPAPAR